MDTQNLLSQAFSPAQKHIEELINSGEITANNDLAESLSHALLAATQKHLHKHQKPISALSIIGKLHTTAEVCEYLGSITPQALNDRIKKNTILRLKDSKGHNRYPRFQFSDGTVNPNIQKIIQTLLKGHFTGWEAAIWLTTPSQAYDGKSAVEYMKESPGNFAKVLAHAQGDVYNLYGTP